MTPNRPLGIFRGEERKLASIIPEGFSPKPPPGHAERLKALLDLPLTLDGSASVANGPYAAIMQHVADTQRIIDSPSIIPPTIPPPRD